MNQANRMFSSNTTRHNRPLKAIIPVQIVVEFDAKITSL